MIYFYFDKNICDRFYCLLDTIYFKFILLHFEYNMKFILILFFVNLINSEEVNKVYYGNWSTPANKYFGPFYNNAGFLIVNNYID